MSFFFPTTHPLYKAFPLVGTNPEFHGGKPLALRLQEMLIQLNGLLFLADGAVGGEYIILKYADKVEIRRNQQHVTNNVSYAFDPAKALDDFVSLLFSTGRQGEDYQSNTEHRILREAQQKVPLYVKGKECCPQKLSLYMPYLKLDLAKMRSQAEFLASYNLSSIRNLGNHLLDALNTVDEGKATTSFSSSIEMPFVAESYFSHQVRPSNEDGVFDDKLVASLVNLLDADEWWLAESICSELKPLAKERIQDYMIARSHDRDECVLAWIEMLLTEFSEPAAWCLATRLLKANPQLFVDSSQRQPHLQEWIGLLITRAPTEASALVRSISQSNILPIEECGRFVLLLTRGLALSSEPQAAVELLHHLPEVLRKITDGESVLHEVFKDPEVYVQMVVAKLIASDQIEQSLQLVIAGAQSKLIRLIKPAVFNLCLRLLEVQSASPGLVIAQWDLFEVLSRKPLGDEQRAALTKVLHAMPLGGTPSWLIRYDGKATDLTHLEKASAFLDHQHEFDLRRDMAAVTLDGGQVQCVLPNIYRMLQLPVDGSEGEAKVLIGRLVQVLCNKEWSLDDSQTAHALFEQVARNPQFPMDDTAHLQLLEKATATKGRVKDTLVYAVDHILKKDPSEIADQQLLACMKALEKMGPQRTSEANVNRTVSIVKLLLNRQMPELALRALENKSLRTHADYSELVEASFLQLVKSPRDTLPKALVEGGGFYRKTKGSGLSLESTQRVIEEMLLANLSLGDVEESKDWRRRQQELKYSSFGWSADLMERFIAVCGELNDFPQPLRLFVGECLALQSARMVRHAGAQEVAQRVVAAAVEQNDASMKSLVILLMSTYKVVDESAWQYLLGQAIPYETEPFANDVWSAFFRLHIKGMEVAPASIWLPMLEIAGSHASLREKLDLLAENSACITVANVLNDTDFHQRIVGLLESSLHEAAADSAVCRPEHRSRLDAAVRAVLGVCSERISGEDRERWTAAIAKIPYPNSIRAASEEIDELLHKRKSVQAKIDKLIFRECASDAERGEYDTAVLPLIGRCIDEKSVDVKTAKVISHLLFLNRGACDEAAAQLLPAYTSRKITAKRGSVQREALTEEAKAFILRLIDRCADLDTIAKVDGTIQLVRPMPFFSEEQLVKIQNCWAVRKLEIEVALFESNAMEMNETEKAAALDQVLQGLKDNEQHIGDTLVLVDKLKKACAADVFETFETAHLHLKIADFLISSKNHYSRPVQLYVKAMMMSIIGTQTFHAPLNDSSEVIDLNMQTTALLLKMVDKGMYADSLVDWMKPLLSACIPIEAIREETKEKWSNLLSRATEEKYFTLHASTRAFLELIVNGPAAKFTMREMGNWAILRGSLRENLYMRGADGERYCKELEDFVFEFTLENQRHLNKVNAAKHELEALWEAFNTCDEEDKFFGAFQAVADFYTDNWELFDSHETIVLSLARLKAKAHKLARGQEYNMAVQNLRLFASVKKVHPDQEQRAKALKLYERAKKMKLIKL